ncbi:carbon storage regulator CsrA [Pseudomonas sp. I2]|uniref:carbon storage regulator CsrA n=1 Tax=Pseudomonas sp. I2 TaxID=1338438 RepID=UPI0034D42E22
MLVIGREVGQVINIGDDIQLKIMAIDGGVVRFGISAPRQVQVHRAEVYRRIKEKVERQSDG